MKLLNQTEFQQTFFKEVGVSLMVKLHQLCPLMQHLRNFRILVSLGGGKIVKTAAAIIGSLYTAPEIRIVMNYASYNTP